MLRMPLPGYNAHIMLGTSAPGLPAWQTPPEVLQVCGWVCWKGNVGRGQRSVHRCHHCLLL